MVPAMASTSSMARMRSSDSSTAPRTGTAPPVRPSEAALRHDRHTGFVTEAQHRGHLRCVARQSERERDIVGAGLDQPVALMAGANVGAGAHAVGTEGGDEGIDEAHGCSVANCVVGAFTTPVRDGATGRRRTTTDDGAEVSGWPEGVEILCVHRARPAVSACNAMIR